MTKAEAEDRLRSVIEELERSPGDAAKWFELGSLRNQHGRRRYVAATFEKAYELDPSPKHAEAFAIALDREGDTDRAFRVMTERIAAGGASVETLLQYGFWATTLLPRDPTRFEHAEKALRTVLEQTSAKTARLRKRRSVAWANLGNLHKRYGKLREAIDIYEKGLAECPGVDYLERNLASAVKRLNDPRLKARGSGYG